MTLDDIIPAAHFAERHRRLIAAPPEKVWGALEELRTSDLPLTRILMAIRTLAPLRGGEPEPAARVLDDPPVPVLAAEAPRRIVAGGVMQPWRAGGGAEPPALDAPALRAFAQPGWVKCGVDFVLTPHPAGTELSTETRVEATDPATRRRFGLYWLLIRAGSGLIRRELLWATARAAERAASTTSTPTVGENVGLDPGRAG